MATRVVVTGAAGQIGYAILFRLASGQVLGDSEKIELRLLAHVSHDPLLVEAFAKGLDVHRRTAGQIFKCPVDQVTPEQRAKQGSYAGCIAGALSITEYDRGLKEAGLVDVSITPTHSVVPGMYSAIIRATKPVGDSLAS